MYKRISFANLRLVVQTGLFSATANSDWINGPVVYVHR